MNIIKNTVLTMFVLLMIWGCENTKQINEEEIKKDVLKVLMDQEAAWNEGDIEKFMDGYWHSDSLRFASGGTVNYGWEETLERYKRGYTDKSMMGHLSFTNLEITVLSKDAAIVFGKWALEMADSNPWGLFTLVFRLTDSGWRVTADHTSAAR